MKKLNKARIAERDELILRFNEAKAAITEAEGAVNGAIGELNGKISDLNAVISDIEQFRDEVVGDMDDYMGDRSEKWADSDNGQNYEAWKQEWEGLDVSEVAEVDEPSVDDSTLADDLEALETEPS